MWLNGCAEIDTQDPVGKALRMAARTLIEKVSPFWLGFAVSGSLLLILAVIETSLGRWGMLLVDGEFDPFAQVSGGVLRDIRIAIIHCLQVGYLPAAFLYVMRSSRQSVLELQDVLNCSTEECRALATSVRVSPAMLILLGILGMMMSIAGPYLIPPVPESPWNPAEWSPEVAWHRILGPVTTIWAWWLGYAVISVSLRMSRIATRLQRVDLLDLSPLAPFTQLGLRNGLVLIGSLSVWSLMMLETGFGQMMVFVGITALGSAIVALVLPVTGVHKQIQQSKAAELIWVNAEVAALRSKFRSPEANKPGGEMADLVAYRGLVDSVPEWPFTTSTYARLFLYLLVPLVTWGIGIVAEEIITQAFFQPG